MIKSHEGFQLLLDRIDREMPASVANGCICNRPRDQFACESVEQLKGLAWGDVPVDAWRRSSVVDALTDEAFAYYLPSLMRHSFESLPEVELSFDSLLFDLKTDFAREVTSRRDQKFSVSEDESRDMLGHKRARLFALGTQGLQALLEILQAIESSWPDDVDHEMLSESKARVGMLLEGAAANEGCGLRHKQ